MAEKSSTTTTGMLRLCLWALFVAAFVFLYYRSSTPWGTKFTELAESSVWLGYAIYVLLCAVRGFALIPATSLLVLAIPLFPPVPLFLLTLVGFAISSASIYLFSGSLKLAEYFERKHASKTERVRTALQRHPTAIVAAWSFLLVLPTDLISYVCGAMKISFPRFMLGVLVGEGTICALYIFAGNNLLDVGEHLLSADAAKTHVAEQSASRVDAR